MTIPPDFPWRPGMRAIGPDGETGCYRRLDRVGPSIDPWYGARPMFSCDDGVPDPNDPATIGALAGAVREAWRRPVACAPVWLFDVDGRCPQEPTEWRVGAGPGVGVIASAPTEFDAWLAAWNARPKEPR